MSKQENIEIEVEFIKVRISKDDTVEVLFITNSKEDEQKYQKQDFITGKIIYDVIKELEKFGEIEIIPIDSKNNQEEIFFIASENVPKVLRSAMKKNRSDYEKEIIKGKVKKVNRKRSREVLKTTIELLLSMVIAGAIVFPYVKYNVPPITQTNDFYAEAFDPKSVLYECDEECDPKRFDRTSVYKEWFEKYGEQYGIDPNLARAVAAHESFGIHKEESQNGVATGIMQIANYRQGESIENIMDYETGEKVDVVIDNISDCESNIKAGICSLAESFKFAEFFSMQGKISENTVFQAGLTIYQIGYNNFKYLADNYGDDWLNHRDEIRNSDPNYFEKVCIYIDNGECVSVTLPINGKNYYYPENIRKKTIGLGC